MSTDRDRAIFTISGEGLFGHCNRVWAEVMGATPRGLEGLPAQAIMRPNEDLQATEPEITQLHRDVRCHPGTVAHYRAWSATMVPNRRVLLDVTVHWETALSVWWEDAAVVELAEGQPLFDDLSDRVNGLAQQTAASQARAEEVAAKTVHLIARQNELPDMPPKPKKARAPRKDAHVLGGSENDFRPRLNKVFERHPYDCPTLEVVAREIRDGEPVSLNTIRNEFIHLGYMRKGVDRPKVVLKRLYNEWSESFHKLAG